MSQDKNTDPRKKSVDDLIDAMKNLQVSDEDLERSVIITQKTTASGKTLDDLETSYAPQAEAPIPPSPRDVVNPPEPWRKAEKPLDAPKNQEILAQRGVLTPEERALDEMLKSSGFGSQPNLKFSNPTDLDAANLAKIEDLQNTSRAELTQAAEKAEEIKHGYSQLPPIEALKAQPEPVQAALDARGYAVLPPVAELKAQADLQSNPQTQPQPYTPFSEVAKDMTSGQPELSEPLKPIISYKGTAPLPSADDTSTTRATQAKPAEGVPVAPVEIDQTAIKAAMEAKAAEQKQEESPKKRTFAQRVADALPFLKPLIRLVSSSVKSDVEAAKHSEMRADSPNKASVSEPENSQAKTASARPAIVPPKEEMAPRKESMADKITRQRAESNAQNFGRNS